MAVIENKVVLFRNNSKGHRYRAWRPQSHQTAASQPRDLSETSTLRFQSDVVTRTKEGLESNEISIFSAILNTAFWRIHCCNQLEDETEIQEVLVSDLPRGWHVAF